ncbi:MAG: hypothetical protein ACP5DZ_05605 [Bacteroidales bacterium]
MTKLINKFGTAIIVVCLLPFVTMAQDEENDGSISDQQVTVITEYNPVIANSVRIEKLPEIKDTFDVEIDFDYDIYSKQQPTTYNPKPLKAATLKGEPKTTMENGYARLLLGSKLMLNADLYYNNIKNTNLNWGIYGSHASGHGRLEKIIHDKVYKVYTGYNKSMIGAFAKRMFPQATLSGSIDFRSNQHFFYGYNSLDTTISFPIYRSHFISDEQYQRYNIISVKTRATSRFYNPKAMNYDVRLNYDLWFDLEQNMAHYLDFNLNLNKRIKKEIVSADAGLVVTPSNYLSVSPLYVNLSPYLAHHTDNFKLKLGLHTRSRFIEDSSSYHFYPDIYIEHNIADVILPYASFSGNLQEHPIHKISRINPYINDTLNVSDVNIKQHLTLGFKGRISDEVQFNLNGHYVKAENQYFFVNDYGNLPLRNRFNVEYADVEMFKFYGELNFDYGYAFNLRAYGQYKLFTSLQDIEKPWHVPAIKCGLFARKRILPALTFSADAFVLIDRYALVPDDDNAGSLIPEKLSPAVDVNLKAEYAVNRQLNAVLELNNLAFQNYEIWNQYPVYGFHIMAGINYSF